MVNTTLTISTYLGNNNLNRLEVIKKSINSLINTNYSGNIIIVDDHSENKEHLEYINSLKDNRISIFERNSHGGVAKTKNTCIRHIIQYNAIGFLADDDIEYKNDWDKLYTDAIIDTGFDHFTLFVEPRDNINILTYKNTKTLHLMHVNGCFLTITKKIIDTIGYFKILPYLFGHEHSNFTIRCLTNKIIPHYMDVYNSQQYINLIGDSLVHRSLTNIDMRSFTHNCKLIWEHTNRKEPCIE